MDKILIVLSATSCGVSIITFETVIGVPVGIANANFTLIFSLTTGLIKKLLSITGNKKEKHDKTLVLAKSKLNSTESLVSQMEKRHGEFNAISNEKEKYEKLKEDIRTIKEAIN